MVDPARGSTLPMPGGDPFVGALLGERYRVVRPLGEGGMGRVYVARHVVIDRFMAIKVMRDEHAARPELRERFLLEARAAARIRHPNVINVTDFGTTEAGAPYMVMELLEGHELQRELAGAPAGLPWPRARHLFAGLCEGVQAAHDAGVVHRDLKPENVFLVPSPRGTQVKVLDFGIAKVASRHVTKTGIVYGTPEYMSPEQARGERADARADIYAAACLLWEMITGAPPLRGETPFATIAMQLYSEPPPLPPRRDLPAGLERVLRRALAKDREERFPTVAELAAAVEAPREVRRGPLAALAAWFSR
jgi:serine/threonine-protein kinase